MRSTLDDKEAGRRAAFAIRDIFQILICDDQRLPDRLSEIVEQNIPCLSGLHPQRMGAPVSLRRTRSTPRDPPKRTLFMCLFSLRLPQKRGTAHGKLGITSTANPSAAIVKPRKSISLDVCQALGVNRIGMEHSIR